MPTPKQPETNASTPRTVMLMMVIMLGGKVLGVLRDRMQGVYLGMDTAEGIAFMQASSLPRNFLDIMFASVFSASFIPVFNAYLETKGKKAAFDLAAIFISVTLAMTAAFTLICVFFTPTVYSVFLDGAALSNETRQLGIVLLRVMFPLMILSGLAFSLTGVLQSLGQFNIPAAMSIVSNGIILVYYYFFFGRFGVYGLCYAFLLGWASQTAIQIPFLVKHRFHFRFRFDLKDPGLRQIGKLALPVMAASWMGPVNLLVNAKASVNLYDGKYGYNAIHFANSLYTIISGVFVLSVTNVIFPKLSKQTAVGDNKGFTDTLGETIRGMLFFLLPMSLGLMAVGKPLIRLVYQGGLFDTEAVAVTSRALFYFSPGIVGYGLQLTLSSACYALKDGKVPMLSAIIAIGVNAALSFPLARIMEVAGPALASAVSISVSAAILLTVLKRKRHIQWTRSMTVNLLKIVLSALAMYGCTHGCVVWLEDRLPDTLTGRVLTAGLPVMAGAAVYIIGCAALKVAEVKLAWRAVMRKIGRDI